MPIYSYQCVECGDQDGRIGGLDDHTALCMVCGGVMVRLEQDPFSPYFQQSQTILEEVYP